MTQQPDISPAFYRRHARSYAEKAQTSTLTTFFNPSHPRLLHNGVLAERMRELVPAGGQGLDAGCGAGAHDVFSYWQHGYDVYGVDAVEENILEARRFHPDIASRVSVADLSVPLDWPDASLDFALCNAVIQHIAPEDALGVTLPELARVLRPGGVLQLMFKSGEGVATVHDSEYDAPRSFQLYPVDEIVELLIGLGLHMVPAEGDKLGGAMLFTDYKPMEHCVLFARKAEA
ncbi:MAG: class I SAM-dependent methyltransferase [Chloroflexota bacterium]|nr:class I SAM-dependent methyltransferase [Chloroflexota bacterium]MDE2941778.1 class I SAM-dependent methyltransferase [Chloroflexota bacterium]MDE3266842.1 class I SAM-dependent methyltransferase [Chloroflexota bacterium]